jgi:hypothetical protein
MRFLVVAAVLGMAALLAGACSIISRGGGAKVAIPETYRTSDANYTLLYSTLGYEANATKRVLVRLNDPQAQVSEGLAFQWQLADAKGKQVAAGRASYAGTAWGIPLWAADFSAVSAPGEYRMLVEAPDVHLATDAFPVDRFLMFKTAYEPLAIDNAKARAAPIELDNGFFDSNSTTGSAIADADFLVGLLESFDRRRTALTEDQKTATRAAIDRSVDYLLLLSDPGSGKFAYQSPVRPYAQDAPQATAAGLRALAHYAAVFQQDDGQKAQRAYRRAKLAETWLQENAPQLYSASLRAAVSYDFYRYTSDNTALQKATDAVRELASTYDMRTMDRASDTSLPDFEAMYRMWRDLPVHEDRQFWQDTAKKVAGQYKQMLAANPFHVIPPGVTDTAMGTSAASQWDDVATAPPPGDGPTANIGNDWFIARAIDAVYLASMTGDRELEQVASASLAWVTGLNPGIPMARLEYTGGGSPVEAASFLTGLDGRTARTWSAWSWTRPQPFATIVNGFKGGFAYDDTDVAGETSLRHDGLWLYAMAVYEDYLNAGMRLQNGAAIARKASHGGAHVSAAVASESGGSFVMTVTVTDAKGAPLPASTVTVAWTGTPLPDAAPETAFHTTTCVTDATGVCTATLPVASLPVRRPAQASVTNVENLLLGYDLASDDASKTALLP